MACTVRLANNKTTCSLLLQYKYFPHLFYTRNFCSKDNGKIEASSPETSTSDKNAEQNAKSSSTSKLSKFKTKPVTEETKNAAKEKLKSLLSDISIISDGTSKSSKLNLAKAVKRVSKKERLAQMEAERITPEKEMNMAVKTIASTFKDDSEKVESELTEKLSTLNLIQEKPTEKVKEDEKVKDAESSMLDDQLSANLMSSVEEVAATVSESPIPPRSELTKRLMRLSLDQNLKSGKKPVRSVIEGMVIKSEKSAAPSPAIERKQFSFDQKRIPKGAGMDRAIKKINLFDTAPLNIFEPRSEVKPDSSNMFWKKLEERELRLLSQFAPANPFEEMIMWTEQGKHWKFPIDNETEIGAEENVGFHEHVFLEHYLDGWCPTKGPIRHFMELVCVGLSKNPYITVERKVENIEWFRNYFKEKEEILREAGAIQ